jgi:hypothetical protein
MRRIVKKEGVFFEGNEKHMKDGTELPDTGIYTRLTLSDDSIIWENFRGQYYRQKGRKCKFDDLEMAYAELNELKK